jgi:penicillin-binding protein 1B
VLDVMVEQNLISAEDAVLAKETALDVTPKASNGITAYPGFLDLVQRQLREYYKAEDLVTEGLRVSPRSIRASRPPPRTPWRTVCRRWSVVSPERGPSRGCHHRRHPQRRSAGPVGDREPKTIGFNRALDAQLAGSLLKPVVI